MSQILLIIFSILCIIGLASNGVRLVINYIESNNKTDKNSLWFGLGFIGAAVLWFALFVLYYRFNAR
jgi:hypothetical protein